MLAGRIGTSRCGAPALAPPPPPRRDAYCDDCLGAGAMGYGSAPVCGRACWCMDAMASICGDSPAPRPDAEPLVGVALGRGCATDPMDGRIVPTTMPVDAARSSWNLCWFFWLPICRFFMQYHRFLTALSGLPGSRFAISLHRFPSCCWAVISTRSSSEDHGPLLTVGSKWFTHRSRHCLALRPGMWPDTFDHRRGPPLLTSDDNSSSSSLVHAPLMSGYVNVQWRRHSSGDRPN
mmetsp:Transcript_48818/g.99310  ORF Transcript_48818/g.99310 Transcript_48818/m.99310 type:complete len:235 (+) Transcript_48818:1007-1711(+)